MIIDLHIINSCLLMQNTIDKDSYERIKDMLQSNDKENWVMGEELLRSICESHDSTYLFDLFTNQPNTFNKNVSNIFTRRAHL